MSDDQRDSYRKQWREVLTKIAPDMLPAPQVPAALAQQPAPTSHGVTAQDIARRRRSQQSYQFLSNMMMMRHIAMMNAIGNLSNNGYYYTYRYGN